MKIKKTFQGELPENRVVNTYSDSLTDAYSANYLNGKLSNVVISATEPTDKKDIWVQIGKNLFDKTKIINNLSPTSDGGFTGASGCATSYVKVNPGDTYMVSSNVERPWVFNFSKDIPSIGVVATPWNISNGNAFQVVVPDGFEYISFRHLPSSPGEDNINQDIQVEQGEFKTDYEPYIPKKIYVKDTQGNYNKIYDESGTLSEVYVGPTEPLSGEKVWVQKGKNLFNINGPYWAVYGGPTIVGNKISFPTSSGNIGGTRFTQKIKLGSPIVLSAIASGGSARFLLRPLDSNGELITNLSIAGYTYLDVYKGYYGDIPDGEYSQVFDFEDRVSYLQLGFIHTGGTFDNVQIEYGTHATDYTNYVNPKLYTKNEHDIYEEYNSDNEEVVYEGTLKGAEVVNVNLNKYKRVYITYRLFDGYGNSGGYSNVLMMDLTKKGSQDERHTASAVCQYLSGGDFSTIQPLYMSIYAVYDPNHYTFFAAFVFDGAFVNGNASYCVQKITGVLK
jgi:hypothetical protein